MSKHGTGIAWTHQPGYRGETWTVLRGCELARYSGTDGQVHRFKTCVGCYAMATAHQLVQRFDMPQYRGLTKMSSAGPIWSGEIYFDEEQLMWPLHCKKPRCFFLTSMGDLFYAKVTRRMRAKIVAVMCMTPQHRYLVLTKRPDVMATELGDKEFLCMIREEINELGGGIPHISALNGGHIYWGTSIEDQATANAQLPHLAKVRGKIWISYEPVIEYADLGPWLYRLAWGVIGGASKQRGIVWPYELNTAAKLIEDFSHLGVPLYHKQLGAVPVQNGRPLTLEKHDNHNADPEHWPEAFRVQEFPS